MAFISQVIGFAIALGSAVTSNTATIATVDTSRSCVMWGGQIFSGGNVSAGQYLGRAVLTNSTTVTATRGVGTNSLTVYGTVVEFDASVITSLEQNSVTIANSATSGTVTLSTTVSDTTKAVLFYHGHEVAGASTSGSPVNSQCALDLTNSTTVTAVRDTAVSDRTVTASFTVIEFDSSFIASVEKRSVTLSNTNATDTDTITSVTTSRSFLVWNGFTSNNGTASNCYTDITLTGATQVTLTRSGTTSASRTIKYTVVELQSGVLDSVEQNTTAVNSVASNTTTITTVDTSRSYLNFQGFNTNAGTQQNTVHHGEVLTNSTTVTVNRNTASTTVAEGAWAVLQFSAGGGAPIKDLAGSIAAQTTFAGSAGLIQGLTGSIAAQATFSGALRATFAVQGAIQAQTTFAGNLTVTAGATPGVKDLAGSIAVQTAFNAALKQRLVIAGSFAPQFAFTGSLVGNVVAIDLTGSISAAVTFGSIDIETESNSWAPQSPGSELWTTASNGGEIWTVQGPGAEVWIRQ